MTGNTDRLLSRIADETDIFATFDDTQVVRLINEFRAGNAEITEDEIVRGMHRIGGWEALGAPTPRWPPSCGRAVFWVPWDAIQENVRMRITEAGLRKTERLRGRNN